MSVAVIAWGAHPDFPLALLASRDERHDRLTSAAGCRWTTSNPAKIPRRMPGEWDMDPAVFSAGAED
ncbi:MAG: NRDE family protein [Pseudomonadota bacterium]|jgi:uncharacterized protein with NRDE domain